MIMSQFDLQMELESDVRMRRRRRPIRAHSFKYRPFEHNFRDAACRTLAQANVRIVGKVRRQTYVLLFLKKSFR